MRRCHSPVAPRTAVGKFVCGFSVRLGGMRVWEISHPASGLDFQPLPALSTYAATKAFVLSLTESLSEELKGTGVTATALCPGVTATNMVSGAQAKSENLSIPDFMIGDVANVAREGFEACMKGEVIYVPGLLNQVSTFTTRNTPKWLLRRITGIVGRYTTRDA